MSYRFKDRTLYRAYIRRYYLRTLCIICNMEIVHNQYNHKIFNRIAHVECIKGANKRGRMNDTIMIKDRQLNKKQLWKRV